MNKENVSVVAVAANIVLAALKIIIGLISQSSAVFAQGLDSITDIISSTLTFFGIRAAKKPADKEHPYGHHKFEVLSGLAVTAILFLTGIWIAYEAYNGFISSSLKDISYLTLGAMAFSAAVNEFMARIKISCGKKEQSISLISDGVHSRIDVISSLVVFAGLLLTPIFAYADPLLTLLIGLYILKESISLGKEALDSLLDVSAGEEIERQIKEIVQKENIGLLDLKTQKKGSSITANLVISLPKKMRVEEANLISSKLQGTMVGKMPNLQYVAIQIGSHDFENSYYQPKDIVSGINVGHGFGWQKRGKFMEKMPEAKGYGPGGKCICPKCGHETWHKRGVPCSTMKCGKCGSPMERG